MRVSPNGAPQPTAQARAAVALRTAIVEGELRPGQRVNQEAWADRVGISPTPVREALRTLAGEGLVSYRPRRGYVVTALDADDLEEVYALRRLLETRALRRGVPRATPEDVEALRRAAGECRAAAAAGDVAAQLEANRRFHDRLHGLAGSRPLTRLIDLLWDSTEAYRALYYALPGETEEADRAHREIAGAVAAHDAARAISLQDAHRDRALDRLRAALVAAERFGRDPGSG
ncbi:MAG: GntR family transcriptional regulator [Gaiellales bacterium]